MSGIKALEKLRGLRDEVTNQMVDNPNLVCWRAEGIADEIEREISERYMELPVDADGVPIHVGDDMANEEIGPLRVLGVFSTGFIWVDDAGECFEASLLGRSKYHHVKPDPIKELLEELVAKVENDANWRCNASDEIDCMTARIREAVKREPRK